jgi:hypothetical protein
MGSEDVAVGAAVLKKASQLNLGASFDLLPYRVTVFRSMQ